MSAPAYKNVGEEGNPEQIRYKLFHAMFVRSLHILKPANLLRNHSGRSSACEKFMSLEHFQLVSRHSTLHSIL